MNKPIAIHSIYLKPGEFFWGDANNQITTVLGSCVAVCLWHPEKKIGCMYHIVMPGDRTHPREKKSMRYGDDAFFSILEHIHANHTSPAQYITKIFGGSRFMQSARLFGQQAVGDSNIKTTMERIDNYGFKLQATDIGGTISRKIIFELWSGAVNILRINK